MTSKRWRSIVLLMALSMTHCSRPPESHLTLAPICKAENRSAWMSVSGLCHILAFYGLGPTDLPGIASGKEIITLLTDEAAAAAAFGRSPFVKAGEGVRYALFDEASWEVAVGEAHRDQCLATFAALDLPLHTPVRLNSGARTLRDLLAESMAGFDLDRKEIAWSAMAFARYLPPLSSWTNRAGIGVSFSALANALMAIDLNSQKCAGVHVIEALLAIEAADAVHLILDPSTRNALRSRLNPTLRNAGERQRSDGMWGKSWCAGMNDETEPMSPFQMSFLVTGHLLDLFARLDSDRRPDRASLERAARALTAAMRSTDVRPNGFWVCPYSHAARGVNAVWKLEE
ncbi:MAG TPA: hypothetical protein VEH04_19075 [Verrucomicrobiae bacterium]|nr:hypothetical protein [Verrucomicrobiae bacterium]